MTRAAPRICCLDLDTFFVSVERLFDPSLVGKAVVVGGRPGQRGVVTAASYEVRALGVRSGMFLTRAYELAPRAVFLPVRHGEYSRLSGRVRKIAEGYSPVVQMASIDEMYIDFAGCERLYAAPDDADADATVERTVRRLTAEIQSTLGLPSSAGIATSRPMAKVACGLAKPAGVRLVRAGCEADVLRPLSVRKYPGIGPVAERKLADLGIETLGQLADAPAQRLRRIFGAFTCKVQLGARGQGRSELGRERPAFQEHDPAGELVGSISNERTFREDVCDPISIEAMLCSLCERVCWRARKRGIKARTVTLKLRYADFQTLSRSTTLSPTHSELELYPVVSGMFQRARRRRTPIRLLGLALSNLGHYDEQLTLFADHEELHRTVDGIRERFGYDALRLALPRTNNKGSVRGPG
ncbi:MAG TPA: DNA polymerase IV [Polyangiaceae bacterium]|nr:DNA polymerase IV [Polyangiaceae bacterium]